MKRTIAIVCLVALLALCLPGCGKYQSWNFVGKTVDQIEEQYGRFDLRNTLFIETSTSEHRFGYGYLIKESRVGFLGTDPAEYYVVVFDKSGIASGCYRCYHSDGG